MLGESRDEVLVLLALVVGAAALAVQVGVVDLGGGSPGDGAPATVEPETTVDLVGADGQQLATVDVAVSETAAERYQGLSGTETLAAGRGMLFVYGDEGDRAFVMREMNYALDIVFVASDGTVTTIHTAQPPDPDRNGPLERYRGRAQHVLEVPAGYADSVGLDEGDRVVVPATYR